MLPEAVEAMTRQLALTGNATACTAPAAPRAGSSRSRASASPQALGARPGEVVFTSGGTEADNLARQGPLLGPPGRGPAPRAAS